jgi:hypothetical protein
MSIWSAFGFQDDIPGMAGEPTEAPANAHGLLVSEVSG